MLNTGSVSAHYCDDYYAEQKNRENCWWRYWNSRPSPQDLIFQTQGPPGTQSTPVSQGPPAEQPVSTSRGTPVDRPAPTSQSSGGGSLNTGGEGGVPSGTPVKPISGTDADPDDGTAEIVAYPTNPSDPSTFDNYMRTE